MKFAYTFGKFERIYVFWLYCSSATFWGLSNRNHMYRFYHRSELAEKKNLVFVTCNDAIYSAGYVNRKPGRPMWTKTPLPSVEDMRQSLCRALLSEHETTKKDASLNAGGAKVPTSSSVRPARGVPRRSGSGVATSA